MTNPATLAVPADTDWIVAVHLRDGRTVKYRVSPGGISEELAAGRALKAGRIHMDAVREIEVCRASDHVKVAAEDYETQLRGLLRRKGTA